MVELDTKFNSNNISKMLKEIKRDLKKVPQEAFDFFVAHTPKKTGNARNKTKLKGMTSRGMRGSDQAPEGMTKPTEKFIKDRVNKIVTGK